MLFVNRICDMKMLTPLTAPQLLNRTDGLSTPASVRSATGKPADTKFGHVMNDQNSNFRDVSVARDKVIPGTLPQDRPGVKQNDLSGKLSKKVSDGVLSNKTESQNPTVVIDEKLRASLTMLLAGISGAPLTVRPAAPSAASGLQIKGSELALAGAKAASDVQIKGSEPALADAKAVSGLKIRESELALAGAKAASDIQIKGKEPAASERQVVANLVSDMGLRTDLANKKTLAAGKQAILKESPLNLNKSMNPGKSGHEHINGMTAKRLPLQTSVPIDKGGETANLKPAQGNPDLNNMPAAEPSNATGLKRLKFADNSLLSVENGNTGADAAGSKQDNTVKADANTNNMPPVNREGLAFKVEGNINTKGSSSGQAAEKIAGAATFNDNSVTLTRKEHSSIGISIEPDGLGKVDIQLSLDKGMINGQINVFDSANKDMLEKNLRHIMEALVKDGLNIGGFSVSLREKNGGMNSSQDQRGAEAYQGEIRAIGKTTLTSTQPGNGLINIFI